MPATIQSPGEHQPLDNTMGAMLVGIIVSAVLYGISLVQTLFYFNRYRNDACDNGQLDFMIWSVLAEAIPTGFTGALVQTFYTVRVWRLSKKNHVLAVVIMLIVLAQTAWVIISLQLSTFQQLLGISDLTISINALSTAAVPNGVQALRYHDQQAHSIRGEYWILIASPNTLLYAPFYFCIGRLYSNSLLATLNARNQIRNGSNDAEHMMVSLSQASRDHAVLPTNSKTQRPQNIAIRIDTAKDYASDGKEDESSSVTF
ncbi:hypothetical protein GG344DRAFT_63742 [Lentinula edodes]|nr:hypothetical protein GG344DRAFT_63742 [Lentinula edodes]